MKKLFQNRNITFLWFGQVISQSGDTIYQLALIWLALELSSSKSIAGLIAMSAYLPAMFLSLPAGVIADHYDRKRIMLIADVFRAVIILGIPFAHYMGLLTPSWLAINAFLIASAASFFNPSRDAIVPQLVPRDGLLRANSLIQTSWQLSMFLGPAVAGFILDRLGIINLFTLDSLAYIVSFFAVLMLRPSHVEREKTDSNIKEMTHKILDGLKFARRNPIIFPLLLFTVVDNLFIMGPAIIGTPVMVREVLHGDASQYAIIMSCYAVGMLLGTAVLLLFCKNLPKGKLLLLGMTMDGLTFVPYFFVRSFEGMIVVTLFHSLVIPFLTVSRTSIIQEVVPEKMTGRVFSLIGLAVVGLTAVSSGLTGIILDLIPVTTLFLIIGFAAGTVGFLGWIFAKSLRMYH